MKTSTNAADANRVGSTGGSALPPSFAILNQAIADDAFCGGEVTRFGDYSVSWNTRENLVAIADSGGWWTMPAEHLKAIASATPNVADDQRLGKDSNHEDTDKIKQLRGLLSEALAWLDDYGMRMFGSAGLADKIKEALDDENED